MNRFAYPSLVADIRARGPLMKWMTSRYQNFAAIQAAYRDEAKASPLMPNRITTKSSEPGLLGIAYDIAARIVIAGSEPDEVVTGVLAAYGRFDIDEDLVNSISYGGREMLVDAAVRAARVMNVYRSGQAARTPVDAPVDPQTAALMNEMLDRLDIDPVDARALPGPVFTRDGLNADGDIIVREVLIDFKTALGGNNLSLSKDDLFQMVGYLLLDSKDRYGIRGVGILDGRSGWLWCDEADGFLSDLVGEPTTLEHERAHFDTMVQMGEFLRIPD